MKTFQIGERNIGAEYPTYIIAEMSGNHGHSFEQAVDILKAAKEAGADAIKLQTYTADTLTIDSDEPSFQIKGGLWDGNNLYKLYEEAYTPWDWQPKLKAIADELKIDFFSTPFDDTAVDFLEDLDVKVHKVASFEMIDHELLKKVASTGKPIIMSTGMATLGEIEESVKTLRENGVNEIALLKCTSSYPAPPEEMNLKTIPHLAEAFDVVAGLSDHTLGISTPIAAVALGARIIEKHFTLSRDLPGPDTAFSLEPEEFKEMVDSIRNVEKALGNVSYGVNEKESKSRVFRRSLFIVEDVKEGEEFTYKNLRSIRPGNGLPPKHLKEILSRKANRDVKRGTPVSWDLVG